MAVNLAGSGTTDPADGIHTVAEGTVVDITATPAAWYSFDHWSGICSGTSICQVAMDAEKAVTTHFADITPPDATIAAHPDER